MKTLPKSIIIENAKIGLHSLDKKDFKYRKEGNYHTTILLEKDSKEFKDFFKYVESVLKEKNIKLEDEMRRKDSTINKEQRDGDIIAKRYKEQGKKNSKGEISGQWLKGTYGVKIGTDKDFKVIDMDGKELDKTKVNWSGATVNVHCSPYIFSNNFGTGLSIILNNIQIVESYTYDSIEDAFGEVKTKEDEPFDPDDLDEENLPF